MPPAEIVCVAILGLLALFVAVWSLAVATNRTHRVFQCVRLVEKVVAKLEDCDSNLESLQTCVDRLLEESHRTKRKAEVAAARSSVVETGLTVERDRGEALAVQFADLSKRFDILDHYLALRDIRLGPNLADAVRCQAISAEGQGERLTERPRKPPAAPSVPPLS